MSSLFTYDVYRTYIKPAASPKETITVSRICVCVFGCLMGILAVLLNVAKVSLGWVYLAMVRPASTCAAYVHLNAPSGPVFSSFVVLHFFLHAAVRQTYNILLPASTGLHSQLQSLPLPPSTLLVPNFSVEFPKANFQFLCALQGVLIGSAVFPIAACLMWSKCSKYGAIAGAFIGQWSGLCFWLVWAKVRCLPLSPFGAAAISFGYSLTQPANSHALPCNAAFRPTAWTAPSRSIVATVLPHQMKRNADFRSQVGYGAISLTTTGYNYPMLAGNLASILISMFVCITVSLIRPDNFDWEATRNLKMVEEESTGAAPFPENPKPPTLATQPDDYHTCSRSCCCLLLPVVPGSPVSFA